MAERRPADALRRRFGRLVVGKPAAKMGAPGDARPRRTPGKMLRAKPPNTRGRGPLLGGPPLGVGVVAIVKDEADYLEEWLAYHLALRVDHFFIYDNGSTDGSAELLERFINHGLVTRLDWPLGGGQLAAYNHSLRMFGAAARWLAYFDPDEYLVPLADDDIPSLLSRYADAAVLRVPRVEFGFSGHRAKPAGLTVDAYTGVGDVLDMDPDLPPRVKSIVQPGAVSAVDIHLAFPADVPEPGQPTKTYEAELTGVVQLNHYYTRSFEEFEAKRFRGSATGRIARTAVDFDLPVLEVDESARRFSARTEAMIERLHQLDPRPYQYGSHIGFEYFPRPNDLFRFGEFAIANWAVGLAEPQRSAAVRLKNLYGGVGLVVDLSDQPTQPSRDALSGSAHVEALTAHMRGTIVNGLSVAPELPVTMMPAALEAPDDGPVRLGLAPGTTELRAPLPAEPMLRCYHLGLLAGLPASVRLEAVVERADGTSNAPVQLELPAGSSIAAIVEVEPSPVAGVQLRLRLSGEAEAIDLFDLFVIATG
jgi:hypothetical protein